MAGTLKSFFALFAVGFACLSSVANAALTDSENLSGTAYSSIVGGNLSATPTQGPWQPQGTVFNLNDFLGANSFYNAGITGSNSVVANIEGGHVWSGHETLNHVQQIPSGPGSLSEVDRHATTVGSVIAGRLAGANPGANYQIGIAYNADLYSGAIASAWTGSAYSRDFQASFTSQSTLQPYRYAFATGLTGVQGSRTADVINSGYASLLTSTSRTATDTFSKVLDALANENRHTLFVVSAGNAGSNLNTVSAPASGFNNISVAALSNANNGYKTVPNFSSRGPNDYDDPSVSVQSEARQSVDLAAPGFYVSGAYYGGTTGGNRSSLGSPSGPAGGADWYIPNNAGTSFSAPLVSGAAALLYDAAYIQMAGNSDARDARVIKAVLMNSAAKDTTGYDNGQSAHSNGNGGVETTQGLDNRVGTGRLDIAAAYDQFLGGTLDVAGSNQGNMGAVEAIGWDYSRVETAQTNDYFFDAPLLAGERFTTTLTWYRDRSTAGTLNANDNSYDNLDLELWSVNDGTIDQLISESKSTYNNTEHFFFDIAETGGYALRVRWTGELFDSVGDVNAEDYGLAWSGTSGIVLGDYDRDGEVDAHDYQTWKENFGATVDAWASGDGNGDGRIDAADYVIWRDHLGLVSFVELENSASSAFANAVPEPSTGLLFLTLCLGLPIRGGLPSRRR